ncbi:hypothetical protein [Olivibacter sp. XZL3]|uniref:hypothetical protein n=1 Tax=Olivibacter sp. XZL3 TaxID=1735116 RepID=UPI0010652AF2|nr:hypothetical protein [Olivibacter sp. XZL3]
MNRQMFSRKQLLVPMMAGLLLLSSCSKDDGTAPDEGLLPVPNPDTTRVYKDGEYTARGVYGGAPSYITVDVKLQNGILTNVLVTPMPENNATSRDYQERFAAAVPAVVEGKHISEVRVGRLAGSSGTNVGFNNAIDLIKEQAAED